MKVAFIDRDGTITKDYLDEEWRYVYEPVLMPYAVQLLKLIQTMGFAIVIITNQYLIGERIISKRQYHNYNNRLINLLKKNGIVVLDVFFCPHKRSQKCECMKPNAGMIIQAVNKYPNIDLSNSIIIGDSICDVQLAKRVNIKAFGINVKYNYEKLISVRDLKELYNLLAKGTGEKTNIT